MIRREDGFTIPEIIVTIMLIGLATTAVYTMFNTVQVIQKKSAYLESATRAAQQEVESLRNNNYNSLTPGSTIDFTSSLPLDLPSNKTGTVAVTEPIDGLKRVDVTVTYTYGQQTKSVVLSSLIGIIGISQ